MAMVPNRSSKSRMRTIGPYQIVEQLGRGGRAVGMRLEGLDLVPLK